MNWLLVFVPVAIGLNYFAPESHLLIFLAAAIAILPLAGWMGHATEHLAERTGEGLLPRVAGAPRDDAHGVLGQAQIVRRALETQPPRVLGRPFAHDGAEDAMKMKGREARLARQRVQLGSSAGIALDPHQRPQHPLAIARRRCGPPSAWWHLSAGER